MTDTKRKMLTPAERVEKIKAELAAAEAKAQAKADKRIKVLLEQEDNLRAKATEISDKLDDIGAELDSLGYVAKAAAPLAVVPDAEPDSDAV